MPGSTGTPLPMLLPSLVSLPRLRLPKSSRIVDSVAGLHEIHRHDVNLVVWHRAPERDLERFVTQHLSAPRLREEREVAAKTLEGPEWARGLLPASARRADPEGAAALLSDVRFLAGVMVDLFGASLLGLRLRHLEEAMCPRFHTDYVGVRLLVTYCGPGTEWLADEHTDRRHLGHRADGVPDERSGVLLPGATIRSVPQFAVALLKGEAWPGNEEGGVVHRSPDASRSPRLLLSLDVLAQTLDEAPEGSR
ncbi:MAG: DUF1826 domain-containing protein [Planctomycetes bacterium]|nr:DUF1826 domain-containing protein [Planctomycetota bacterium]